MKKAVVTLLLVCNVLFAAAIEKNPPKPTAIINIWENMTPPTSICWGRAPPSCTTGRSWG